MIARPLVLLLSLARFFGIAICIYKISLVSLLSSFAHSIAAAAALTAPAAWVDDGSVGECAARKGDF